MIEKKCIHCGILFGRKLNCQATVNLRKFCSKKCANNYHGISPNCTAKGRKHTPRAKRLLSQCKLAEKNPMWKGDEVKYGSLHVWVKVRKPKPLLCEKCKSVPPYDLTSIDDRYTRNVEDWQWLCRRCHMESDGRLIRFTNLNKRSPGR